MSSGSRHTVLSVAILIVSVGFTTTGYRSRAPRRITEIVVPAPTAAPVAAASPRTLRICADPNNLPFSNQRGEGFENRIASLVAHDLGREVQYYWWPQRRGFIRQTLDADACDVIVGLPSSVDRARTTRPYYRSSFVFVFRRDRRLRVQSFDDPRLRRLRIGVQITGEDYGNPSPVQALAAHRLLDNMHGYPVYGDYSSPHPSTGVLDGLIAGEVDAGVVWGPIAGYVAAHSTTPLRIVPIVSTLTRPGVPLAFDISMAVRRTDAALASALDRVLARRAGDVQRILAGYGVPFAPSRRLEE